MKGHFEWQSISPGMIVFQEKPEMIDIVFTTEEDGVAVWFTQRIQHTMFDAFRKWQINTVLPILNIARYLLSNRRV